jgi:hypothetical protein
MILIPFYDIFPKIAEEETQCFHLLQNDEDPEAPPTGSYSLVELYCPDRNCDCRKANIVFISNEDGKECGTIQFGWEDQAFYNNHFGFDDHGLPGPDYAPMQFHGKYAHFFLRKFQELCVTDKTYVTRLEGHYNLIKEESKNRDLLKQVRRQTADRKTYRKPDDIVKRNDLCSCGSGKKHKKCCLYQTAPRA